MTSRGLSTGTVLAAVFGTLLAIAIVVIVILAADRSSMHGIVSMRTLSMTQSSELASPVHCPLNDGRLEDTVTRMRTRVRAEAERRGTVDWPVYNAFPSAHVGKRVVLHAHDFRNGTLRLVTSGVFVLVESVVFEPQAWNDWRPARAQQPQYGGAAFTLDFFAALTVEAIDVVIDLDGHTLEQSRVHALQQRFFAHIELGSAPFITGQGPASFGADVARVNGCVVENGVLGRSSHHGVHGNGGQRVWLRDLVVRDYEVAAIALNGFKDVVIERVHAAGSSHDVAVLGTYSNARFALPFVDRVLADGTELGVGVAKLARLADARDALAALMQHTLDDVRAHGALDAAMHPDAAALFDNPHRVVDGNTYALVLHPLGVAVGGFWTNEPPVSGDAAASERIYVINSVFERTHAHVIEVVALVSDAGTTVRGPVGDVLRIVDNHNHVSCVDSTTGAYRPNALADVQIALIDASLDVNDAALRRRYFGTTHGNSHIVEWARGTRTLGSLVVEYGHRYVRNGDTMFHTNKGVQGVMVAGSRDVCLQSVTIADTRNSGERGHTGVLPGELNAVAAAYVGATDGGHPDQAPMYGYMGADARGLAVTASHGVHLHTVHVLDTHARWGFARAIDVFNRARNVHAGSGCKVSNVTTLVSDSDAVMTGRYANGPKVGAAHAVHCSGGSASSTYGFASIVVNDVQAGAFDQSHTIGVSTHHEPAQVDRIHGNLYELNLTVI